MDTSALASTFFCFSFALRDCLASCPIICFQTFNMASVDGRRSLQKTSDSIFTHECGPCKTDDKVSEAKYYCRVCNDYLCEECKGQHRKFKELQNHKIVSAAMTTNNEAVKQAGIPGLKCMCNQNLVEFFLYRT